MNFGVKQLNKKEEFQSEILAEITAGLKKQAFYLEDFYCTAEESKSRSVAFDKRRAGMAEIEFVGRFSGKRAIITLKMDGVIFLQRSFIFSADAPTYFSYTKTLFVPSGKHEFSVSVEAKESSVQLKQGKFAVTAGGISPLFTPQVSFALGAEGEKLYLCRYSDGYYLCRGEIDKTNGRLVTFAEEELPQKAKLKVFKDKIYFLYKSSQGVWKLAQFDEIEYYVPLGVELAMGSDCDFCFKSVTDGEVYYVLNGELFRFGVYNLFATKSVTQRKKVNFEGVSQRVKGIFVAPYDNDTQEGDFVQYVVVWGTVAVVTALVNGGDQTQDGYCSLVKVISEPNAVTAFAQDNIFGIGALKQGLLTEYKVVLSQNNVDFSVTKKRYLNADAIAVKTLSGFAIYDDGEYFSV